MDNVIKEALGSTLSKTLNICSPGGHHPFCPRSQGLVSGGRTLYSQGLGGIPAIWFEDNSEEEVRNLAAGERLCSCSLTQEV